MLEKLKEKTKVKTAAKAKKVTTPKPKEKPVVIAKRTVKEKTPAKKKKTVSPTQLIDDAVSKIEKQVKSETKERAHIDEAISKLEKVTGVPGLVARSFNQTDKPNWHEEVFWYQKRLEGFWGNPRNFHDAGLPAARELLRCPLALGAQVHERVTDPLAAEELSVDQAAQRVVEPDAQ